MSTTDDDPKLAPDAPLTVAPSDVLDLHTFAPRDAAAVTEAFLDDAKERGLSQVRIIHGKGIGALRRTVRAVLERHPAVDSFETGGLDAGGWGATIVRLREESPSALDHE